MFKAIDALPVSAHPMTQFATGVMALQVVKWTSDHNFLVDALLLWFFWTSVFSFLILI